VHVERDIDPLGRGSVEMRLHSTRRPAHVQASLLGLVV